MECRSADWVDRQRCRKGRAARQLRCSGRLFRFTRCRGRLRWCRCLARRGGHLYQPCVQAAYVHRHALPPRLIASYADARWPVIAARCEAGVLHLPLCRQRHDAPRIFDRRRSTLTQVRATALESGVRSHRAMPPAAPAQCTTRPRPGTRGASTRPLLSEAP